MTATLTPEKYDEVTEALKDVMDPELGINVVDLGLIYDLSWDDENDALVIHMTLPLTLLTALVLTRLLRVAPWAILRRSWLWAIGPAVLLILVIREVMQRQQQRAANVPGMGNSDYQVPWASR